ncbi:uncharacterized protein HMPREF1541_01807 [Cyphellophora europaea CBS 101466]|uniref:FAD-binding domain-containing protein n=1 Tax=Cyphellophora europaea (strain CBS 101466) TaxID=1220924 RepID=W2S238_CYPE1|nr:uncharacterized protein HMPREF1541_01807 [Cyphellophora europaea CBS 101466]ETN42650.1 hypothetical protein HMPREF1541_01807 [Cyphellophora europaea CBS 101466]
MASIDSPIIIIGAGLVGLTLAQGLKKAGFKFEIYDRDNSLHERPAGWGITMHWALPALASCLPPQIFETLLSIQVDPVEGGKENDYYQFLDFETGAVKFAIPSSQHYRLNRKLFRELLCTDIPVQWNKRVKDFTSTPNGVTVNFSDGTTASGSMLLAVDGKNSRVKRQLVGDEASRLSPLPVAFNGLTLRLSPDQMAPFRAIHPVLWQGCHPKSGFFVFFSMLSTPASNGSATTSSPYYEGQFNMSWLTSRHGPTPSTPSAQLAAIKRAATSDTGFFPTLRDAILAIPDDTPALEIKLEDWPTQPWLSGAHSRVSLVGDAAHTMTMYRGEAANHGIYDAVKLVWELTRWRAGEQSLEQGLQQYQDEVVQRTHEAVLLSREACLECHDIDSLSEESAVFRVAGFNAAVTEERPTFDIAGDGSGGVVDGEGLERLHGERNMEGPAREAVAV